MRDLIRYILTPSGEDIETINGRKYLPVTPGSWQYRRTTEDIGHEWLGKLMSLFPLALYPFGAAHWQVWVAGVAVVVIYWIVKEAPDLRRGGGLRDGLVDAGMTGAGMVRMLVLAAGLYELAGGWAVMVFVAVWPMLSALSLAVAAIVRGPMK